MTANRSVYPSSRGKSGGRAYAVDGLDRAGVLPVQHMQPLAPWRRDPGCGDNASADRLTPLAASSGNWPASTASPTPGPTLTSNSSTAARPRPLAPSAAPVARARAPSWLRSASVAPSRAKVRAEIAQPGGGALDPSQPLLRDPLAEGDPLLADLLFQAATCGCCQKLPRRGNVAAAAGAVEHNTCNRSRCPAPAAADDAISRASRLDAVGGAAALVTSAGARAGLTSVARGDFFAGSVAVTPTAGSLRTPSRTRGGPQLDLQLADPSLQGLRTSAAGTTCGRRPGPPGVSRLSRPACSTWAGGAGQNRCSLMCSRAQASWTRQVPAQGLQHDLQPLTGQRRAPPAAGPRPARRALRPRMPDFS